MCKQWIKITNTSTRSIFTRTDSHLRWIQSHSAVATVPEEEANQDRHDLKLDMFHSLTTLGLRQHVGQQKKPWPEQDRLKAQLCDPTITKQPKNHKYKDLV